MPLGGIIYKRKRARKIGAFNDRPNLSQGRQVSNGWQQGQKKPMLQKPEGAIGFSNKSRNDLARQIFGPLTLASLCEISIFHQLTQAHFKGIAVSPGNG